MSRQAVSEATLEGHHKGNGWQLGAWRVVGHNFKPSSRARHRGGDQPGGFTVGDVLEADG
jgi:hypothetical protein